LGLEIGLALVLGLFLGRWLDGELGVAPWGKVFGLLIGTGAAVKSVLRVVKKVRQKMFAKEEL
jgi:F0F1-type ATP synthase assembly protein I